MENSILEIRTTSESLSHDADLICKTCTRYAEVLALSSKVPPPSLPPSLLSSQYIYGLTPGETHHAAFTALGDLFTGIFAHLGGLSQTLTASYAQIDKGDAKWTENANSTISAVDNAAAPLQAFLEIVRRSSKSQASKKIAHVLGILGTKGKSGKAEIKKLQKFVSNLIQDRTKPDAVASQQTIFTRAESQLHAFREASARLLPICQFRARAMNEVLGAIHACSVALEKQLRGAALGLRAAADAIDHRRDFELFISRSAVIRYDLQCNPFVPIDLSHPVFGDIDTRIQIAVPPIYPIGIATITEDFIAEGGNELSVTRWKYVLLMEWPGSEWICVMNPLTRAIGYTPATVVRRIADALGVVVEVGVVGGDAYLQRGDYLAVTGATENQWKGVTTRGEEVMILKEHVAIIYD
jgi:hypothetical protein